MDRLARHAVSVAGCQAGFEPAAAAGRPEPADALGPESAHGEGAPPAGFPAGLPGGSASSSAGQAPVWPETSAFSATRSVAAPDRRRQNRPATRPRRPIPAGASWPRPSPAGPAPPPPGARPRRPPFRPRSLWSHRHHLTLQTAEASEDDSRNGLRATRNTPAAVHPAVNNPYATYCPESLMRRPLIDAPGDHRFHLSGDGINVLHIMR